MNFNPDLSAFQGLLLSANNAQPFDEITCRGGFEEPILNIVSKIFKFLVDKNYITTDGVKECHKDTVRKLCFYLILNADFSTLKEITDYPEIGHIVWTTPTISKCLLSEIIWSASFDEFAAEAISFSNPALGTELLQALVESLKYSQPESSPSKLAYLLKSCYSLTCRLHFFDFDNSILSKILNDLFESCTKCLNYFSSPPNSHKMNTWSKSKQYKYLGDTLNILMTVILDCLKQYESVPIFKHNIWEDLYLGTIDIDTIKNISNLKVSEIKDGPINEQLEKYNLLLADKSQELVMNVSVDVFCCWSEFEANNRTLQKIVGETAYELHSKIAIKDYLKDHPLVSMLPNISCKPIDVNDEIKEASYKSLIEHADNDSPDRSLWIKAILEKHDVLTSENLVDCLLRNSDELEAETRFNLFKNIVSLLKEREDVYSKVKNLAILCYHKLDPGLKKQLALELFNDKQLNNLLETDSFDSMATELYNKAVQDTDINSQGILDIFIQNPFKVYSQMVFVGYQSLEQSEIIANLFTQLNTFADHYYPHDTEPSLIKAIQAVKMENIIDKQKTSFVNLLKCMKTNETISGNKLLMLIIMPNLHKALVDKDIKIMHICILILRSSFSLEELVTFRAPLLAMLAQVLNMTRWKVETFSCEAPSVLEETIELQTFIMESYPEQFPEKDSNWLKSKIVNLQPLNMFYYKKLWQPKGENYLEIISGEDLLQIENLTLLLAKILPVCTLREWYKAWECLKTHGDTMALDVLHKATCLIIFVESASRTEQSEMCLKYCYRNFTLVIKNCYLQEPASQSSLKSTLAKIVSLSNIIKTEDIHEFNQIFLPLLLFLVEKTNNIQECIKRAQIQNENFSNFIQDYVLKRENSSE